MKASEWIAKKGWSEAKDLIALNGWKNTPFLVQVKRLVASHALIEKFGDVQNCNSVLAIAPYDATHVKVNLGMPIFYLESSNDEAEPCGLWIDDEKDGYWGLSSYQNYELLLVQNKFIALNDLKEAVADVESCYES